MTAKPAVGEGLKDWLATLPDVQIERAPHRFRIQLFAYWGVEVFAAQKIDADFIHACYTALDLPPPADVGNQLSKLRGEELLVRSGSGYRPSSKLKAIINDAIQPKAPLAAADPALSALIKLITRPDAKDFLDEAHACLRAEAPRAAIVMTWIVTMDHMYEYVLRHKLGDFNAALSKRSMKLKSVTKRDDFGEMKESEFIELCRSAGIITQDVRKILDEKLGLRNTAAHPSTVKVHPRKAANFMEDLVENVLMKHPL